MLEVLSKEPNSGISIINTNVHMALSPSNIEKFEEKVLVTLDGRLFRFHNDFDGMLLHHQDAVVVKQGGSFFIDEVGYPHLDVKLKAYIFRPLKGIECVAEVYEANSTTIACRLFDNIFVNVLRNENLDYFDAGDKLRVILTEVSHKQFRTTIFAKMLSVVSKSGGNQQNKKTTFSHQQEDDISVVETPVNKKTTFNIDDDEDENVVIEPSSKKKKKKRKHSGEDGTLAELNPAAGLNDSEADVSKPKKKKKADSEQEDLDSSKVKKKKKKKDRQSSEEIISAAHG